MTSEFVVFSGGHPFIEGAIDSRFIRDRRLFKTLSLFAARRAGVNIPHTVLLLEQDHNFVQQVSSHWHLPLMVRMDYSSLPTAKPLGGIPIYSVRAIEAVSDYLFGEQCYPLLHPHIDRFSDIYSVGLLLNNHSPEMQVEVVGRGFDASDLRLGMTTPHESFVCNVIDESVSNQRQISIAGYEQERIERAKRIAQFHCYIDFANQEGQLLPSLDRFKPTSKQVAKASASIPARYTPLAKTEIKSLAVFARKVQMDVLPSLPNSESFVASFSAVPGHGWVLWDVYGHWYKR